MLRQRRMDFSFDKSIKASVPGGSRTQTAAMSSSGWHGVRLASGALYASLLCEISCAAVHYRVVLSSSSCQQRKTFGQSVCVASHPGIRKGTPAS
jgi:hypothetical protein